MKVHIESKLFFVPLQRRSNIFRSVNLNYKLITDTTRYRAAFSKAKPLLVFFLFFFFFFQIILHILYGYYKSDLCDLKLDISRYSR